MPVPGTFAPPSQGVDPAPEARGKVVFDGAHGVGAPKLSLLAPSMAALVHMEVRNPVEGPGELNDGVGAEHVQKTRTPPAGVDSVGTHSFTQRWKSLRVGLACLSRSFPSLFDCGRYCFTARVLSV